ncbi:NAD(P)H-binding protein [Micromonospora sp. WMMD1082]|uniref:SDR family oxidoreductase n=1 Tax=Micromonospora sp. WMMD1082 TaxID=3016104 RepID=UPI00241726C3|nr:NAD(P)H-binding protein [Micromonospora sp. WMMD1082]MDG4794951.1 NAD(P)H-binding protein [Micromonospora sp. WMMD1082]
MTILVTGATGHVGRELIVALLRRGEPVRALTRFPETARLPAGVEVVGGDLADPDGLGPALRGVTAVHLITRDFIEDTLGGDDYHGGQTPPAVVDLISRAGARRVTLLTSGDPGPVEHAAEHSDVEWTRLLPQEIMTNVLEWAAESIRADGVVREPFADRPSAVLHEADIAEVAAIALVDGGHAGRSYTLTGPEVLSPREMIRTIGATLDRHIPFIELTEEEARQRWRASGYAEELIDFMVAWFTDTPVEGRTVSPAVEEVTGRPGRTFAQWAAAHAAAFRP